MLEPACRVYGNRRLVHCLVLDVPEPQVHGAPPPSMPPAQEQAVEVPAEKEVTKAEKLKEPVKAPAKPHSTEDVHPHLLDDGGKAKQAPDAGLSAAAQKEYDQSGQLPPGQAEQAEKPREDKTTLVSASASTTTAAPPLRYRLKRASFDASHPMIGGSLQQTFASWEPCARAIETERNDFWEFIVRLLLLRPLPLPAILSVLVFSFAVDQLCNLTFATVALFVIVIRGRILAGRRFNAIMSSVGYPIHLLTQSALRPT